MGPNPIGWVFSLCREREIGGKINIGMAPIIKETMAAPTSTPEPPRTAPATEQTNGTQSGRRIMVGDIDLPSFYHQGAIIRNEKGAHLLLVSGWGPVPNGAPSASVVRCDPKGEVRPGSRTQTLSTPPATALFERVIPRKPSEWSGSITLVRSALEGLPSGTKSDDPALLLIPYGPHYGKTVGLLSEHERYVLHKLAKNGDFKKAIEGVKPLPGASQTPAPPGNHRLSERGVQQLLKDQGEVIRGIPLVTVIEQYCAYAPEKITGNIRKYRVGAEFINLNVQENSFGSLNGYEFKTLKKPRGSTNNAMDMVAAVKEMEGARVDFKAIRSGLISHFNLQPQLDRMFADALRREAEAQKSGQPIEYAPAPKPEIDAALKEANERKIIEEQEVEFNLATGLPVTASAQEIDEAKRRGGGFAEREDLWPKARKYLVEERKLDPHLIDYLYENRNLYAARRTFARNSRFPYRDNFQDVIVCPVFGFKTGEIVGVDTKPLPNKPGEKTEGRNHGKTGQGAFMFGTWGPETKRVILTEGFIKGIAFLQLHRKSLRIGPETCLMSRSGAKPTLEIIPQLKEWGAEAIVAYDNDFTGRDKAKAFKDECERQGVPCKSMFVEPAEVTLSISQKAAPGFHDAGRAQLIEQSIVSWATDNGVPWAFERDRKAEGYRSIRMPNTETVIYQIEEFLKEDRKISGLDFQARAKDVSTSEHAKLEKRRWLKLELHHKDWDDVVKKGIHIPKVPEWRRVLNPAELRMVNPQASEIAPAPPHPAVSVPQSAPNPDPQKPTNGVLVVRGTEAKGLTYSIGTATQIFDLRLSDEQKTKAGSLLAEELPRDARISSEEKPRLLEITNIDGASVSTESLLGPVELEPAPEKILKAWLNPTHPPIVEAVLQLQRENGVPIRPPAPVIVPAPDLTQK